MPNVLDLLNHDHREVEQLFTQFESTQDVDIALQICQELTVHSQVEEELVYPVLASIDAPLEHEAEQEHAEAKQLIARIEAMASGDPDLVPTVMKLKGAITHHVDEEESEAWPKMRSGAGDRLDELGRAVEQRKQELQRITTLPFGTSQPTFTSTPTTTPTSVRSTGSVDLDDKTRDELYELAKEAGIEGRSTMKKAELKRALARRS